MRGPDAREAKPTEWGVGAGGGLAPLPRQEPQQFDHQNGAFWWILNCKSVVKLSIIYCFILTTNLAECVCVCAKCDPFLPLRFHFFFKLPEFFFRIAKFPYAAFGPLFVFHCPIFFTKNNTLNGVCILNVTAAH